MKHLAPVLAGIILLTAAVAAADTLVTTDGKTYEGRLVQRTSEKITFEVIQHGGKMRYTLELKASEVQSLVEGKLPAATSAAPGAPGTPAAPVAGPGGLKLPPEPVAPPVKAYSGSTYYLIPLHGTVGENLVASVLEKSLADAAKRKPTVVILEVSSPGGHIAEVEKIVPVIRAYGKQLRLVAYVKDNALSAAAVTAMSVKEIYMNPGGKIGAATAYAMGPDGTPADISEKFQSVWRAAARSCCELGGHEPLLAEAMVDRQLQLYLTVKDGKTVVTEQPQSDGRTLNRRGRLLTLTAREALTCGLSAGMAEDYAELGKLLKLEGWTECAGVAAALAQHRTKVLEMVQAEFKKLHEDFRNAIAQAEATRPDHFTYHALPNGQLTAESQRQWLSHSATCGNFLLKAETSTKKAGELAKEYPELIQADPDMLRKVETQIKTIRDTIARRAYRKSVAE